MGRNSKADTLIVSKPAQYQVLPPKTKSYQLPITFPDMEGAVRYLRNREGWLHLEEEQLQQRIKEMIKIVEPVYKTKKVLASVA